MRVVRGVRRVLPRVAAGVALAGLYGTLLVPAASADPAYPSAADVERSKNTVSDTAAQVGRIEARLAAADARSAQLATAVA
ncbi:MAG: hypothetical protein ACXV0U_10165 [Kineosporiaceae bacterium]